MEYTINEIYQNLLPRLPKQNYETLKESIEREGQHLPILVNQKGVILDGHTRLAICKELGISPKVETRFFRNPLVEQRFVIEINLLRRDLTTLQKVELALPLLEIQAALAKQRKAQAKGQPRGTKALSGSNDPHSKAFKSYTSKDRARDRVAHKIGISPTTFQRAKTILEEGPKELKEKVRAGKTSINYAYGTIKRKAKHLHPPPLPIGNFDVIYADPPWHYELPLRGAPNMHYPTMSVKEMATLKLPVAKDAIIFMWATNPKLEEAFTILKAWGFQYKTNMVWIKDQIGTGYYFRGQHELLLVGKKGEIPVPIDQNRPPSVMKAPRKQHSQKPIEIYSMIERMYPNREYLELFARTQREGWHTWGNQITPVAK